MKIIGLIVWIVTVSIIGVSMGHRVAVAQCTTCTPECNLIDGVPTGHLTNHTCTLKDACECDANGNPISKWCRVDKCTQCGASGIATVSQCQSETTCKNPNPAVSLCTYAC